MTTLHLCEFTGILWFFLGIAVWSFKDLWYKLIAYRLIRRLKLDGFSEPSIRAIVKTELLLRRGRKSS